MSHFCIIRERSVVKCPLEFRFNINQCVSWEIQYNFLFYLLRDHTRDEFYKVGLPAAATKDVCCI